jgi:hypothetical protein
VRTGQRTVGRVRFVVDGMHRGRVRIARGVNVCGETTAIATAGTTPPPPTAAAVSKQTGKTTPPRHHRRALGARFVKGLGGLGTAGDVPLWAYALVALAVALLIAAALLPRTKARLSSAFLLAFVGAGIILVLTIVYALG